MRLLPILGILAVSANLQAQPQAAINRQPVSEEVFATIADHYGYDRSQPLNTSVIGIWPHRRPYVIEKVEFSSIHNERVSAYFTHPKDSTATRQPAVLLLHGANDFWGKNEDWALEWMDILAREGWCVLVADFYGFGERKKAGQMPSWGYGPYTGRDMTIQSVTDQRRGIDFLFSRPEVDTTKVALMGGSMGGYFGTLVAGLENRFTTVVLTVTGAWPSAATDDSLARFSHTLNFAPRVSAPILMVNATGDGRPFGEELYNAMPEPKQQIWYESEHYLPPREYNEDILSGLSIKFFDLSASIWYPPFQKEECAMKSSTKYPVHLTEAERQALKRFVASGQKQARPITRARILLLADAGQKHQAIAELLAVSPPTVSSMCKKYATQPYDDIVDILPDAPRSGRPLAIDSRMEAHIALIACSEAPEGAARWTLHLIADRLVQLEVVDSISHERVRQALKKTP